MLVGGRNLFLKIPYRSRGWRYPFTWHIAGRCAIAPQSKSEPAGHIKTPICTAGMWCGPMGDYRNPVKNVSTATKYWLLWLFEEEIQNA
jgi:hypothetical protein